MNTTDATEPVRPVAGTATSERRPGAEFQIAGFRQPQAWMDPFMSVVHFMMDEPTFRPHAHAGFSAVTVMFEDSPGSFRNRDSIGSDLTLSPGDLHWTRAGSGVQHEEIPTVPGIAVHGAQIFVALPPDLELTEPLILHADAADIPAITSSSGASLRVLAGELDGVQGIDPGHDVTVLDVTLPAGTSIHLDPGPSRTAFIVPIKGQGNVNGQEVDEQLAVGFDPGPGLLALEAGRQPLHLLVGSGTPLRRASYWVGGIAMSSPERSNEAADRFRAGAFGDLDASF